MIALIFAMAFTGLIVGGLGRLVVPGPNPMSIFRTILIGLAGSFLGGLVGRVVLGFRYRDAYGLSFLIAVLCTAVIVYAIDRPKVRR